jgi:hypothetical protein
VRVQNRGRDADSVRVSRHRLVVGIAVLLYLGLGGLVIHAIAAGSAPDSDLSDLDPVFDAIIAVVYVVGAGLLVRNARSGKTWRALLVPFAFFFPALLITVSLVLLALGGTL